MLGKKLILWDFEGTLARRFGGWAKVLTEVLLEHQPTHIITPEEVHPFFSGIWPWNFPERPHPHITTAEAWWRDIEERILVSGYLKLGCPVTQAEHLARLAHHRYLDTQGWFVYEDVLPTLAQLKQQGWEQVILSNHVPELPSIADALGFSLYMEAAFTSALTGYEKPHPQAFHNVLEHMGHPQTVWMIGDNIKVDVNGAEKLGIPAVLVRNQDARATRSCPDLSCLLALLANTNP